jgi:hypothetical protein
MGAALDQAAGILQQLGVALLGHELQPIADGANRADQVVAQPRANQFQDLQVEGHRALLLKFPSERSSLTVRFAAATVYFAKSEIEHCIHV